MTIGQVAERTGVATSALRYYEAEGLVHATRTPSGQRRFGRDVLRRVSFVRAAQEVGLSLEEIRHALGTLPEARTPTEEDWTRFAAEWKPMLDEKIARLSLLRDRLAGCIGCGCLSLRSCRLVNPGDRVGKQGPGPRYLLEGSSRRR